MPDRRLGELGGREYRSTLYSVQEYRSTLYSGVG